MESLDDVLVPLRQYRLEHGLSYRALASRVGVSLGVLFKSLNLVTTPNDVTLHKMRRFVDGVSTPKRRARRDRAS